MNMATFIDLAPAPPTELRQLGVSLVMLRDILLKSMFRKALDTTSALAHAICLPNQMTQELIDLARQQKLLEATGTLSDGSDEMGYQLTKAGQARALEALAQSEYFGPVPVSLDAYRAQVERQSVRNMQISRAQLTQAMGDLILPDDLLSHLGPAVSAGRSILMYGPPGNGKSSISNGIRNALGDHIYVPHAIEYGGQIITLFDPIVHTRVSEPEQDPKALRRVTTADPRYVRCERPSVVTGGELTLDKLDLVYNPTAKTYQAPLQLKATGGVFIVDDLGRQQESPQSIINRWIVPLEEGKDILALQSGEKFEVPFDTLVIFSTNFHPNEIFDGAALRRIFFKIKVDGPDQDSFLRIFANVARANNIALDEPSLIHLLKAKYPTIDHKFANYQPKFLVDQMLSICAFEGLPPQMTPELIDRAWANMFVRDEVIQK